MSTSVKFDSNVWESIVDEQKRENAAPVFTRLFEFIKIGEIEPYFFEGIATMETVKKTDRKDYIRTYQPGFSTSVDGEEVYFHDGSGGPAISDYLNKVIPQALSLGFRFTRLPRIGAPLLNIPEKYWAPDKMYSIKGRQNRSFECVTFIESLGAGKGMLMNALGTSSGFVQKMRADHSIPPKKCAKAVGEWADGDALAASYGYGIDYFCTNDRASSARGSSIFYPTNLHQLEQTFPVNVVSPDELVKRLCVSGA